MSETSRNLYHLHEVSCSATFLKCGPCKVRPCSLQVLLNGSNPFWRERTDQDGVSDVEESKSDDHQHSAPSFSYVNRDEKVWCEDLFAHRSACWKKVQDKLIGRTILIRSARQKGLFAVLKPRSRISWLTRSKFNSAELRDEWHLTVQFSLVPS